MMTNCVFNNDTAEGLLLFNYWQQNYNHNFSYLTENHIVLTMKCILLFQLYTLETFLNDFFTYVLFRKTMAHFLSWI